jgi:hypothetical protein
MDSSPEIMSVNIGHVHLWRVIPGTHTETFNAIESKYYCIACLDMWAVEFRRNSNNVWVKSIYKYGEE